MVDQLKALWPLLQTLTGGVVLAVVLGYLVYAAINGKIVSGWIYRAKCAEAEFWKLRYLDKVDPQASAAAMKEATA